jgi:hypothetical protein
MKYGILIIEDNNKDISTYIDALAEEDSRVEGDNMEELISNFITGINAGQYVDYYQYVLVDFEEGKILKH